MDHAEGQLCETCIAALNGETKIKELKDYFGEVGKFPYDNYHHQTYREFVASKDGDCFICTWLWDKVPLLPDIEEGATEPPEAVDGFRIYLQTCAQVVRFHVVCPWAADIKLGVSMSEKRNFPSIYAHHRPGSPPPPVWTELDAQPWSVFDENIGSSQSLQKVKDWMATCFGTHEFCNAHGSDHGICFPTRAIDVDQAEAGIVHLRDREEAKAQHESEESEVPQNRGVYPPYWTISHRWGDPKLIPQLSKTTERRFRDGMPVDELSPTFRDAALLVHRLGYRYIWIDSICIFQDSLAEWQQEAKAMVDVYRNSLCNIAAIAASFDPSRRGLFRKRRLQSRLLFPFKADPKLLERSGKVIDGPWIFWNDSFRSDEIETSPLSTRGWVVQERFLAPRILHFTENQIYWECHESRRCEADPTGELLILRPAGRGLRSTAPTDLEKLQIAKKIAGLSGALGAPSNMESWYHAQWGTVVSIYANCALTNESDRLIAMSGIAKTFEEAFDDTYLAGLWKKRIDPGLAWTTDACDGAEVYRSESYAPTWSWASVVGGHRNLRRLYSKYETLPEPLIRVVDERIVTEPPGGDPTGLLRSAELDVECMLYYYRWVAKSSKLGVYTDESRTECYFERRMHPRNLSLDTKDLVREFAEADMMEGVCVPLCGAYQGHGGGTNVYLMLEHDSGTRFKRIGVFKEGEIGKWISEWSGPGTRITLV